MSDILKYREYEEEVYDWLMSKHTKDSSFTFSLRQKKVRGSETDFFIGTSKSKYFGTTFWTFPAAYPGSAGDCINLIFRTSDKGYSYFFEFTQTNNPHNEQNELALKLLKAVEKPLDESIGLDSVSGDENKIYSFKTQSIQPHYSTVQQMLLDVDKQLSTVISVVDNVAKDFIKQNPTLVFERISIEKFRKFLIKKDARLLNYDEINSDMNFEESSEVYPAEEKITKSSFHPINQIFYGPPGTGKTYRTVLEAAKIISGNENIKYDEALAIFNENLGGQIEFITFHQNYSYEDFIQGLRPDTENGSILTFEKKDGVFKRIADRALKNIEVSRNPAIARKDFDLVFQELLKPLNEGDIEELEIKMKKSSFFITEVGLKSIEFRKNIGESNHTLSINTLRKMYERGSNDLILGGLQPYYNPILEILLEKGKSNVQTIAEENFVIIIDEINRANISRVFGELITLIEEDKRSHGKIPMRVTLPSGDSFIVPSNLYIIGTMNTADKSIALLDIALRRRFEFIPMYPDLKVQGINDILVLEAINKAILDRKNHDFTIGHSYFMGDSYSREKTINNKVIPLLLEYFMNDEKEVIAILNQANLKVGNWPLSLMSQND